MSLVGRYAGWVVRHRRGVLAGIVAVTIGLTASATRLKVEVDPDRQLPQDHPYIQTLNDVYRLFGDKNLIVVGLFPKDRQVFTPAFLAKLAEVTERLKRVPGANASLIASLATRQVKVIRGSADGFEVERIMETPPTDAAGAAAVRERAFANPLLVDTLVSRDGSAAAIQASFELTPATPGYRNLHAAVLAALEDVSDGTFDTSLSGPVVFLSQISTYASRMAYYFPLALLVIGLIHFDAFRTIQGLVLPIVTALLSVVWALGVMGALGVPLDTFNTTTPILILAVAAGHAVQVLKRFYEEYDRVEDVEVAIRDSLAKVGPVMLAAGLVAALSFCSLVTFRTATIRTFGLFTGFGIASALLIEMTLIPAVRAMLPAPKAHERQREAAEHRYLDAFLRWAGRMARPGRRWVIVGSAVVLVVVCALLARRIEVDMSLKREFKPTDPVRVEDARLNARFAGTNTLFIVVEGEQEEALVEPAILRAIDGLERWLERDPAVGKAMSYVDYLVQMQAAMMADRPNADRIPGTARLAAQYLFLYSMSGGDDFDTILDPTHRVAKVRLLVHEDSTHYGERLIATAQAYAEEHFPPGYRVRFTGTLASASAATQVMVEGKLWNILQIAAITITIAAILLRSFVAGLLVALPLALAVAVNFGVMGLIGIPLDSLTSAISAMAVGIGADYAMYLLFRVREERAHSETLDEALQRALATAGKAVLFVSSAIACGYATLCLSGFALHVHLGALVALAMIVSSFAALVLLPAVVSVLEPAFLAPNAGAGRTPTSLEDAQRCVVLA